MQLTDLMIYGALLESQYMTAYTGISFLFSAAMTVIFAIAFLVVKNRGRKIWAAILAVIMLFLCVTTTVGDLAIVSAIENDEWVVHTDTVSKVMERHRNGNISYFMVLENYGHVPLEDYLQAIKYYKGEEVYVVVVPYFGGYKSTGLVFSMDTFEYTGDRCEPAGGAE